MLVSAWLVACAHRSASPTTNVRRSSLVFLLRSVGSSLESQHSVARASGIHCSLLLGTICWATFHHQSPPAPSSPATALLYASGCAFSCAAWSHTCRCSVHGPTVPDRRRQTMPFCRLSWTEGNRDPPCNVLCWLHLPAAAEMSAIGVSPVALIMNSGCCAKCNQNRIPLYNHKYSFDHHKITAGYLGADYDHIQ